MTDVFAVTSGLDHFAWRAARFIYRSAGRNRHYARLYNRVRARADYDRAGLLRRVMGRTLRRAVLDAGPLVVAHPLLVALLRDRPGLVYQHGEVAAPRESWVRGRHRVIVPVSSTADAFLAAGLHPDQLFVSGLCIEPALVAQAEDALTGRLARLAGTEPLCGAFFSSGAEPRWHVETIVAAALSAVGAGGHVRIFARRAGALARSVRTRFAAARRDLVTVRSPADVSPEPGPAAMLLYDGRRDLNELTRPSFASFDYFVAPAHERTGWALGLGLPMFVVEPPLGSFAPLNREFLLAHSVAEVVNGPGAARGFGARLTELRRQGRLGAMAEAGWGRFEVQGFARIARMLGSQ